MIQDAFSFIFEQVADSGERERFRTRLERVNGKTEVYISHQKMVETGTVDNTGWKWIEGKEDPNLNAAMLARLMVFLGTDMEEARRKLQEAEEVSLTPVVDQSAAGGTAQLTINESSLVACLAAKAPQKPRSIALTCGAKVPIRSFVC